MLLKFSLSLHLATAKQRSYNGSRNVIIFVPFAPSLLQYTLNHKNCRLPPRSLSKSVVPAPRLRHDSTMAAEELNAMPHLYNTRLHLTKFCPFSELPANLHARILIHAALAPRTRFLQLYSYSAPTYTPKIHYIPRLPPHFHMPREMQSFSITHEGRSLIHLFATENNEKKLYFKFERYIVLFTSRFTFSGKSSEASRQRELSLLLKPAYFSKLRKTVVTYSSLDDYAARLELFSVLSYTSYVGHSGSQP